MGRGRGLPGVGGVLGLEDGLVQELRRVLVEALAQLGVLDEQPQRLDVEAVLHRHLPPTRHVKINSLEMCAKDFLCALKSEQSTEDIGYG